MTVKAELVAAPQVEVIEFDDDQGRELVKMITLGVFAGGARALEHFTGRLQSPLPPPSSLEIMTADEVADFLRLDRKTVYDYATRGVIPHQRIGKRMLFSRVALVAWLGRCSKGSSDGGSG